MRDVISQVYLRPRRRIKDKIHTNPHWNRVYLDVTTPVADIVMENVNGLIMVELRMR